MNIDYNEKVCTKFCEFDGEMEDGRTFTINANWCAGDENWKVDSVYWNSEEGTPEEEEEIIEEFLSNVNG